MISDLVLLHLLNLYLQFNVRLSEFFHETSPRSRYLFCSFFTKTLCVAFILYSLCESSSPSFRDWHMTNIQRVYMQWMDSVLSHPLMLSTTQKTCRHASACSSYWWFLLWTALFFLIEMLRKIIYKGRKVFIWLWGKHEQRNWACQTSDQHFISSSSERDNPWHCVLVIAHYSSHISFIVFWLSIICSCCWVSPSV